MQQKFRSFLWLGLGAGAFLAYKAISGNGRRYSFRDKVVVITGGSRGLGLVIARMLAKEGAKLAICSRTGPQLESAAAELREYGIEVLAIPCDLTIQGEATRFIDQVQELFGRIDVLINNAGVIQVGPLEDMKVEDYRLAMNTHFWAPLYTMLATVPGMQARGEGRIVNIASVGGKVSVPHIVPYSASKFALVGLSEGFRNELQKDNILVTTVNPGLFRSGSPVNVLVKGQTKKEYAMFATMGANSLTSSSVENTARQVIEASRSGEAEVVTNLPARFLILSNNLFPELTAKTMGFANKFLPDPVADVNRMARGAESDSDLIPEHLRERTWKAAARNNEI
ncbi:SDR family NAD(P)-dependent oxidoreductase [Adhaeribacter soli]|uniref:SDR family NAD(P)-dependent oxidoreductase n=1 Tax=Adhaeribacter soli TaxID=2607655 RepID=A0A5N1JA91_9BACT|nr:SDR family NAD(P)-dependent oxidoreductase [Adhaeribacter soli]KAA9345928.1 SDR family NAD(P)-dependent oxidoreductase [Adhaeribacter soli]